MLTDLDTSVMLAIIGLIQAVCTSILGVLVKQNGCGGKRCQKSIKAALKAIPDQLPLDLKS